MFKSLFCLKTRYLVLIIFSVISSCSVLRNNNSSPFILKEVTYQSWVVNENEKGTDIVLKVVDVPEGISFDSLVFKGVRVPVTLQKESDFYSIKGVIRSDLSHLKPEKTVVNKPDQLIYTYQGRKYYFKIQSITRKEMKYL
jgi:hypothetical protein